MISKSVECELQKPGEAKAPTPGYFTERDERLRNVIVRNAVVRNISPIALIFMRRERRKRRHAMHADRPTTDRPTES